MTPIEELEAVARKLTSAAERGDSDSVANPLKALDNAASKIGRAFSGSWLGYHSRVYYEGLEAPPPGANFSSEWGLKYRGRYSPGDWREFDFDQVKSAIDSLADFPNLEPVREAAAEANRVFDEAKTEAISIIEVSMSESPDPFLGRLKSDLEKLEAQSPFAVAQGWKPRRQTMTRDTLAAGQGGKVPPHTSVLADVSSIRNAFEVCSAAAGVCIKAASHLERKSRKKAATARIGTNVFIGHGRSAAWRELKDFVQDRLGLPWDEVQSCPRCGCDQHQPHVRDA